MSITVTLSNPRHIAAAEAAYSATIPTDPGQAPPYPNAGAYVQARIEDMANSWIETTKVDQISVGDFILRFTPQEIGGITLAAETDPIVGAVLATVRSRENIRLGAQEAVNGMNYLISIGLLTPERAGAIFSYG